MFFVSLPGVHIYVCGDTHITGVHISLRQRQNLFAICDIIKSDLGNLMESLKYASIISYEVVYLFRFSSVFSLVTSVH